MKTLTILGSTGSIGTSTLDVVKFHPDKYKIDVMVAGSNLDLFTQQCLEFQPKLAVMQNAQQGEKLKQALSDTKIKVEYGDDAVIEAAKFPTDWTMSAIVGAAGLKPTLEAIKRGTTVALSNKESIVCAGAVMMQAVLESGAKLLPVDSEHNALFQLMAAGRKDIEKVIITASGGPFRTFTLEQMRDVTPAQAVKHPKWAMGAKNSIDSATLMNKGLELIEASVLFDLTADQLSAVVHPQSLFHGLVVYKDGSHLAQFAATDMKLPIAHSLAWPNRITTPVAPLSMVEALNSCSFEEPDYVRFPSLKLAMEVLSQGQNAPTILNAANEIAVTAFIDGKIGFLDMYHVVADSLASIPLKPLLSLDDVFNTDAEARRVALDKTLKFVR